MNQSKDNSAHACDTTVHDEYCGGVRRDQPRKWFHHTVLLLRGGALELVGWESE
eukprot:m.58462 g.58462  ORF g.58462 m.58462 type:complete len:54 (-) comp15652_c0_seq2:198-359(-)